MAADKRDGLNTLDMLVEYSNNPKLNNAMLTKMTAPIVSYANKAKTLEGALKGYVSIFDDINEKSLESRMVNTIFVAYLYGWLFSEKQEKAQPVKKKDNQALNYSGEFVMADSLKDIPVKVLKNALEMKPKEAVKYLKDQGYDINFDWKKAAKSIKDRAFIIGGVVKTQMLNDFKGIVQKAISEGQSLSNFRKDLKENLKAQGWSSEKGAKDILESPRRMNLIYHQNMFSHNANAKWDQMQNTKKLIPYIVSIARNDGKNPNSTKRCKALHKHYFRKDDKYYANNLRAPREFHCYSVELGISEMKFEQLQRKNSSLKISKGIDFKQHKYPKGYKGPSKYEPDFTGFDPALVDKYEKRGK